MRAVSNKNLNKRSRVICSSELFSTQNMEGTGSTTLHRAAYSASVLVVPWVSPWSPMCTEGTVVPWPPQGRNRGAVQWRPPPHNPNPSLAPKSHHWTENERSFVTQHESLASDFLFISSKSVPLLRIWRRANHKLSSDTWLVVLSQNEHFRLQEKVTHHLKVSAVHGRVLQIFAHAELSIEDDALGRLVFRHFYRFVQQWFVLYHLSRLYSTICTEDNFWLKNILVKFPPLWLRMKNGNTISFNHTNTYIYGTSSFGDSVNSWTHLCMVDPGGELLGRESPENKWMHSTNARTGQHHLDGLRYHGHVDENAISLLNAVLRQYTSQFTDLLENNS